MIMACFTLEPAVLQVINEKPLFITSEKDNIVPVYKLIKTASII